MISAGSISDDDVSKRSEGKTVDEWSLIQMAGRMEIISLHEISLAKFIGSGGYGEVTYQACYLDGHAQFQPPLQSLLLILFVHLLDRWCLLYRPYSFHTISCPTEVPMSANRRERSRKVLLQP